MEFGSRSKRITRFPRKTVNVCGPLRLAPTDLVQVVGLNTQGCDISDLQASIDTGLDSPEDIVPWKDAPPINDQSYKVVPCSVAVLYAPVCAS